MSNYPTSFDRMLDAWNERDPGGVRQHLDAALAPDVVFIDPTIVTHGIAEFEKNVHDFRVKYPTALLRRSSAVDSHHHLHKYHWEIIIDSKVFLPGFDVTETNAEGKVVRVLGFFGPLVPA
jgi:SnoaL-like domain